MSKKISQPDIPQVDIQKVNQAISDDYDGLNAKNAAKAIRSLDLDALLIATAHELRSKQRRSVIRVALSKISKSPEALALKKEYQQEAEKGFTILQVGQTGVGKSSTINSLFDDKVAKTHKFRRQTDKVEPYNGTYNNVKYTIYDTPGLGEKDPLGLKLDDIYLSRMKKQCSSPDVLWYVLRLDDTRVREADTNVLKLIRKHFGDAIWDRTMVVFTFSDKVALQEEFKESFDGRTETINEAIAEATDGKVLRVPAVAVANVHKCALDEKSWLRDWLGELFITSFERLNPECQKAFLLAFAMDLEIPKPQPPEPKVQKPEANSSEEATENKGRIVLTEEQVERVKESSSGISDVLTGVLTIGQFGATIDLLSGGATLGIPTVISAVIGGIAGFIKWLWD